VTPHQQAAADALWQARGVLLLRRVISPVPADPAVQAVADYALGMHQMRMLRVVAEVRALREAFPGAVALADLLRDLLAAVEQQGDREPEAPPVPPPQRRALADSTLTAAPPRPPAFAVTAGSAAA
jgi:hypothetical protein